MTEQIPIDHRIAAMSDVVPESEQLADQMNGMLTAPMPAVSANTSQAPRQRDPAAESWPAPVNNAWAQEEDELDERASQQTQRLPGPIVHH